MAIIRPMEGSPFDAVVFAGGGNRCLWQAGFYETVAPAIGLAPTFASGSSAGATIACMTLAGRAGRALEHFKEATGRNRRNVYPLNAWRKAPVFPHYEMYRRTIVESLGPDGFDKLRATADVRVQLTRLPPWLGPRLGAALGLAAYQVEKALSNPVHQAASRRLGFRPDVARVHDCADVEALADLLLASSCAPPFMPVLRHGGRVAIDGGVVENVPVAAVEGDAERILVLLTRTYAPASIPHVPGRTYVQPSRDLPIGKFDYTRPDGLQEAYDLGLEDGARYLTRRSA